MATRSYVIPSEYDPAAAEFTVATIDGNPYLQMGALDRDDSALFRSLIDGYAGFFQNGQQVATVRITARYDANKGVQLESLPVLTIGGDYHVRFTQARPGRDGRDGSNRRTGGMQPFSIDGMMGRHYGPMIPFNVNKLGQMRAFTGDPMTGKPSGEPMLGRYPKKRQSGEDILDLFDGIPELVADHIWHLLSDRIPEDTDVSRVEAFLEAYIMGYTNAFTDQFKAKLEGIEDNATRDQTDAEILDLIGNMTTEQKGALRFAIDAMQRRSGADVLAAMEAMNTAQEGAARAAIHAAQDVHSHDDHYYTEGELNNLLAGKAPVIHYHDGRYAPASHSHNYAPASHSHNYAPASHSHNYAPTTHSHDGRYYTEGEILSLLAGKAPTTHYHDGRYAQASHTHNYAPVAHSHDGRYYTEGEIGSLLAGKAPVVHYHDGRYYTETEADGRFAAKVHSHAAAAPTAAQVLTAIHGMTTTQRTSARVTLNAMLNRSAADVLAAIEAMSLAQEGAARAAISAAPTVHYHDSRYYTEGEANNRFAAKVHSHAAAAPTAAQVLAAMEAMNTAQKGAARAAIKSMGGITIVPRQSGARIEAADDIVFWSQTNPRRMLHVDNSPAGTVVPSGQTAYAFQFNIP